MRQIKDTESESYVEKKGYGIDELRYRRAYAMARYEMAKMSLQEQVNAVRSSMSGGIAAKGIAGRLLGSLNYLDWAILAFRVVSKIKKWRRRKS